MEQQGRQQSGLNGCLAWFGILGVVLVVGAIILMIGAYWLQLRVMGIQNLDQLGRYVGLVAELAGLTMPTPTEATIPRGTPSPVTYADIQYNFETLTDFQWESYEEGLRGTRVPWVGEVR